MRRWTSVGLALGSWLVALGCQTAMPSAPPAPPTAGSPTSFPLAGTSWLADEIEGQRVADRVASTLTFDGAARVVGSTGCNRYVAPLDISGTTLQVGEVAMTRRACPSAVMDQERRFVAALAAVRAYRQEGDALVLLDGSGRPLLRLSRSQARALSGVVLTSADATRSG